MPRNPTGREDRDWLEKIVALAYGKPLKELSRQDQTKQLNLFTSFCTPEIPRRGALATLLFRYVSADHSTPPPPTFAHAAEFQRRAKAYINMKLTGQKATTGAGASPNAERHLCYMTSQNPVDTALTRLNWIVSQQWDYLRRCPRADYPTERCRRVFVLKKLPEGKEEPYCSRRCRQRMRKREEDQISEDRYGVRGRKPKEGE